MGTPIEKLQTAIRELETELRGVTEIDGDSRQRLETAIEEVRGVIRSKGAQSTSTAANASEARPHATLSSRLSDSIDDFESSHPHLTMLVSTITDLLAQIGI